MKTSTMRRRWMAFGGVFCGAGLLLSSVSAQEVGATLQGLVTFQRGGMIRAEDFNTNFSLLATAIQAVSAGAGDLQALKTQDKSSLVSAINEVQATGGPQGPQGEAGAPGERGPAGPGWQVVSEGTFSTTLDLSDIPSRYRELRLLVDGTCGGSPSLRANGEAGALSYAGVQTTADGYRSSTVGHSGSFRLGRFYGETVLQVRLTEASMGVSLEGQGATGYRFSHLFSGVLRGHSDVTALSLEGTWAEETKYALLGRE